MDHLNPASGQHETSHGILTTPNWVGMIQANSVMHVPGSHNTSNDSLSGMNYWLIDFGASRHMAGCRNFLVNILSIAPSLLICQIDLMLQLFLKDQYI